MENISQTDDNQAIQASIQASIQELMGEAPATDEPAEAAPAPPSEAVAESVPEAVAKPAVEESHQEGVAESVEISTDAIAEEAGTEQISFEDSTLNENFAQETDTESIQNEADDITDDIQFEEVLDIDAIQQKLLDRIYEDDPDIESSQDVNTVIDKQAAIIAEKKAKLPARVHSITSRKYVIYVDSENIDFMENLTIDERKEVINRVLKEQHELSIQNKEFRKRKKQLNHALIACFTFIIGFPIMFILVNKSIEASLTNYQQAKQNVSKLYKEGGKVKMEQTQQ